MSDALRLTRRDFAVAGALFIFSAALWTPLYTDSIFISGGADYLRSARLGFWSEYFDLHSTSLVEVVTRYVRDPEFRQHPWRSLDELGSDSSARHFHVPAGFYVHALLESFSASARLHRMASAVTGALFIAFLFLLLRHTGMRSAAAAAGASGGLAFLGPVALTFTDIDGHDLYLACALLFLATFSLALQTKSQKWWTASLIVLAGATAALELAPFLGMAAVALLAISPESRLRCMEILRSRPWWWSPLWFAAALFVFWPGGVLKGGYAVSYVSYIYIPLFRTVFFHPATTVELLMRLTDGSSVLLFAYGAMLALAVITVIRRPRKDPLLIIFLCYTLFMAWQGHRNRLTNPTYVAEFIAPLWVTTAIAVDRLWARSRRAALSGAAVLLVTAVVSLATLPQANRNREATARRISAAMAAVRAQFPPGTCFLAPVNYETLLLYLHDYRVEIPVSSAPLAARAGVPPGCYALVDRQDFSEPSFVQVRGRHSLRPIIPSSPADFWVSELPVR